MIVDKTLRTLELHTVLARLAESASFSAGKDAALGLVPATELSDARARLAQTTEARQLLAAKPATHLGGVHDIRPAVRRAEIGSVLTPDELIQIADTLGAIERLRAAIRNAELDIPWLRRQAEGMREDRPLRQSLMDTFSERGEVLDSASPALRRIRHDLRVSGGRLTERLNGMVASPDYRSALQEPIVTMRNGRYVLPVRAEARGKVPGIVHDQSASGQTIFVEPLAVTDMNNRIKELELDEQREIDRILAALSSRVGAAAADLGSSVAALADVDLAFAKARYAAELSAIEPTLNSEGRLMLQTARHPLLRGDVVPISLWLGAEFNILVITGPNTGGKTVSLKTAGLLTLMAQCGLHIPAAAESEVAVFREIFADIGDEQSIEQSLSTFSSHMRNIIAMLPEIGSSALVLLDELGAGTDPAEGAALARAILMTLVESGARAVVTTHFSELKTFAHEVPGVENASVEFDVDTLSPTYTLTIGVPGRSQALAIARRLGMPQRVLAIARQSVSAGTVRVEKLLTQIQQERQEIGRLFARAAELHDDARILRDRVRDELSSVANERKRVLREAREESAAAVRELRAQLRDIERDARGSASKRERRETRTRLDEVVERTGAALGATEPTEIAASAIAPLQVGATVRVVSVDQPGTVVAISGGEAEVQVGQFKMRVGTDDLEPLTRRQAAEERLVRFEPARAAPSMEIDIRGMRADEAVREIDQYLHDNYLHGQGTVRVIHGKGTGALRHAVREELASHPLVKSIESEHHRRGGEGVTVIRLNL